jgi:hypothetical protein
MVMLLDFVPEALALAHSSAIPRKPGCSLRYSLARRICPRGSMRIARMWRSGSTRTLHC